MKTLFQTAFWLLIVYSAITIDNASMEQIAYEMFALAMLIFPAFYYRDLTNYLNKPQ